jgi:hypothetical protein
VFFSYFVFCLFHVVHAKSLVLFALKLNICCVVGDAGPIGQCFFKKHKIYDAYKQNLETRVI